MAIRLSSAKRRRLLMDLSNATKDNIDVVVKLKELADKSGITLDEARFAFIWMLDEVFAKGNWTNNGTDANIMITVKGSDEAERLRTPIWKRFLTSEATWFTVAGGVITGSIILLLQWLIRR